ncbi:MAG: hypothetical protein U9Q82_03250 [Chloroflexota bacterium]|nr:hypothetical protein [Chloroflexota bacterium]
MIAGHRIITSSKKPPAPRGLLYEYLLAGNGLFLRAERPDLSVLMPLATAHVRGLPPLTPFVEVPRKVSAAHLCLVLEMAIEKAKRSSGFLYESLFYLYYNSSNSLDNGWDMSFPAQHATRNSVRPAFDGPDSTYAKALIDLHSHHEMQAVFSIDDDAEEVGFRIYAVLGTIFKSPTIRVRVGVYGHWWEIPAEEVFNLPEEIQDAHEEADHEARSSISPSKDALASAV